MSNTDPALDIKIDIKAADVKQYVSEAIFSQLDEETRNALIQTALEAIIAPRAPHQSFGEKRPSLLQEAFNEAVGSAARGICREAVRGDLEEKVAGVVHDALEKAFTGEARQRLVDKVADGIGSVLHRLEIER